MRLASLGAAETSEPAHVPSAIEVLPRRGERRRRPGESGGRERRAEDDGAPATSVDARRARGPVEDWSSGSHAGILGVEVEVEGVQRSCRRQHAQIPLSRDTGQVRVRRSVVDDYKCIAPLCGPVLRFAPTRIGRSKLRASTSIKEA